MADVEIPDFSLVLLVGASGAGKSTFASLRFAPTEVLSSDAYRGMVCDDPTSFAATDDAFAAMADMADRRLAHRRLTVVDATNLDPEHRAKWLALARARHAPSVALVLDVPVATLRERAALRPEGATAPPRTLKAQADLARRAKGALRNEGWRNVHGVSPVGGEFPRVVRVPLWTDKRSLEGPFDVVGDVHGCADELEDLLALLGYRVTWHDNPRRAVVDRPDGSARRLAFLGDYVDRGPRILDSVRIAMAAVAAGGVAVAGNHDDKLSRWLRGEAVDQSHGFDKTVAEVEADPGFRRDLGYFLDKLVGHAWLDGGALCVAHAAISPEMVGRGSSAAREYCVHGPRRVAGADGKRRRVDWARNYRGDVAVAYGHVVVASPEWTNGTVDLDTGCVFGGRLTAMRWPEREFVSVPARREWHPYGKPFPSVGAITAQQAADAPLGAVDALPPKRMHTALAGAVKVDQDGVAEAVEELGRHGVDPRWLPYVPPTMSPVATSRREGWLEHPDDAYDYYAGFDTPVVLQEKHMGSRALALVCATPGAGARFGEPGRQGAIYTRNGRPLLPPEAEARAVAEVARAAKKAGLWERLESDWMLLDCEALPWSLKAMDLVRNQYAPLGAVAADTLARAADALRRAAARGVEIAGELASVEERARLVGLYDDAWRRYVEPDGALRIAPFHVVACEGRVTLGESHVDFHMATADALSEASPLIASTRLVVVDPSDESSRAAGTRFFESVVAQGGEGVVAKPLRAPPPGRGHVQPALKVRGRDYLRIVYGPEYDRPENLSRLRQRAVAAKRSLATRETAVGLEGLSRLVEKAPLRDVYRHVVAVLALERERVDGRL